MTTIMIHRFFLLLIPFSITLSFTSIDYLGVSDLDVEGSIQDSTEVDSYSGLVEVKNNLSGYFGYFTHHITEGDANNNNYAKGLIYNRWLFGHSINSWGNHSFIVGRLFYIKQKYLTEKLFAEFKFSIAVASGYGDYRNLPIGEGLTLGFIPSICAGYRVRDDLELGLDFIWLPTAHIGVLNFGVMFRKVFSK